MRFSLSPKFSKSAGNLLVVGLLASTATGCSSDVTRFGGLFSSSGRDQITTSSIPPSGQQGDPVPRADLGGSAVASQSGYGGGNNTLNQPYPARQSYEPVRTSSARMASSPVSIQRSDLAAPTAAAPSRQREKEVALAQPFPASAQLDKQRLVAPAAPKPTPDSLTTGTTPKVSGWSATNAPSVTLRPGESIATLSRRFGVPEKEILRVNNLKMASAAKPGQAILIPTLNGGNAAKAASQAADLSKPGNMPDPAKAPEQKVAVVPGANSARDKTMASTDPTGKVPVGAGKDPKTPAGSYVVKQGDSLAKIAKATGTNIDDLKAANNLSANSLRVGQALKLPNGSADTVKTASIPAEKVESKPADPAPAQQTASVQPAPYKAPVATQSVDDVEKKSDVSSDAPESTGIGKYRWPVRGQVIAAYGANVNGNRNDGIDISVPQGTPIKAAENGVVIYAGNGLKELGNTVLVRHDDGTVTVYGNADTLSVTRGQKIQRGQTVAVSGMSGDVKQPQVHFEVRKDASPVNPMTFLE
ncbi:peptidoglycan DD-metalloendopeptidase family protein [Rhizobium lentis]|uniref:peptidoglycan DD-metalloendopeptidase family protein n=1 Tax=Rhizobium lentis TaxID=1138194 RepID=UPI001C83A07C|nr:peptidoglycan DD-metalloendopeptidase family protein [Rhizobium lentis]MBX5132565.1 peptidoglycan DD-metalloendopeptidase family protein [Rhizobium lentis]MBX5141299.1 peptidoglycan DD-metalloendopeptidase family protein [Rhizobium lentis]MBX5152264.1 peptidoglycan DD-metalloendopeptidase family protein [Rhizobium lentis]MBX5180393.1 peptidoglycan DD-metalloendopeptidase family protein [Rhizobium lentis]